MERRLLALIIDFALRWNFNHLFVCLSELVAQWGCCDLCGFYNRTGGCTRFHEGWFRTHEKTCDFSSPGELNRIWFNALLSYSFLFLKVFWRFLLQRNLSKNWLEGMSYAVFGLGDSSYQKYNVRKWFWFMLSELVSIGEIFFPDSPYLL